MKQSWSIVIMCYNEVATVAKVVKHTVEILKDLASEFEIILVDDGSTDGTRQVLAALETSVPNFKVIYHAQNRGIGHTLRSGYFEAQYENLCAVPADGQFDLNELKAHSFVPANTFVSFYRKENTTYTFTRNALSWFNRKLNWLLLGMDLKDVNWVKIYKNETIKQLDLKIESSLVESEICAKLFALKHKPIQVQSKYLPREAGQSKGASFNIVKQALLDTLFLAKVVRRFRKKAKPKVWVQKTMMIEA